LFILGKSELYKISHNKTDYTTSSN